MDAGGVEVAAQRSDRAAVGLLRVRDCDLRAFLLLVGFGAADRDQQPARGVELEVLDVERDELLRLTVRAGVDARPAADGDRGPGPDDFPAATRAPRRGQTTARVHRPGRTHSDWTISFPPNRQQLTSALRQALYERLCSGKPVGLAMQPRMTQSAPPDRARAGDRRLQRLDRARRAPGAHHGALRQGHRLRPRRPP